MPFNPFTDKPVECHGARRQHRTPKCSARRRRQLDEGPELRLGSRSRGLSDRRRRLRHEAPTVRGPTASPSASASNSHNSVSRARGPSGGHLFLVILPLPAISQCQDLRAEPAPSRTEICRAKGRRVAPASSRSRGGGAGALFLQRVPASTPARSRAREMARRQDPPPRINSRRPPARLPATRPGRPPWRFHAPRSRGPGR